MRPSAYALVLCAVLSAACQPATSTELACPTCRIELEPVTRLGSPQDPVGLMPHSRAAVDSEGNYYVIPTSEPGVVAMFDSHGRYAGTFGRAGDGPGEFRSPDRISIGPGDTIHVAEWARHTKLAPRLSGFVASTSLPYPPRDWLTLPDGGLIVQYLGVGGDPRSPLHRVSAHGDLVGSFGGEEVLSADQMWESVRLVALSREDAIWTTRVNEYRVDLWGLDGSHRRTVTPERPWFPPWTGDVRGEPLAVPLRPRVAGIREDREGRLWLTILVAAEDWAPFELRPDSPLADVAALRNRIWDTILEVIDPESGRPIARQRFTPGLLLVPGTDLVYATAEDDTGSPVLDVWRVRLTTDTGGGA